MLKRAGIFKSDAKSILHIAGNAPNLRNPQSPFCYNKSATVKTLTKKFVGIIIYMFLGWKQNCTPLFDL